MTDFQVRCTFRGHSKEFLFPVITSKLACTFYERLYWTKNQLDAIDLEILVLVAVKVGWKDEHEQVQIDKPLALASSLTMTLL